MRAVRLYTANVLFAALLWLSLGHSAHAQSASTTGCGANSTVKGSLVTLINSGVRQFTCLERESAIANQATYNKLTLDPDGPNGPLTPICDPLPARPQSATCAGATLRVFLNTQELVHTANELLGGGAGLPTLYSLGTDAAGLGFALRWTAAEEMLAPGQASTEFANSQMLSAMSRLTALRMGSRGFSVAGVSSNNTMNAWQSGASEGSRKGGAASADEEDLASKWGGFLNGSFAWGNRAPTNLVDAFAFDGKDLTLGVDYRVNTQFVFGGMISHSRQRIEFDSTKSVVEGDMQTNGNGLTLYALQEWKGPYLSGSLGLQRMDIDSRRVINYPSFNIFTESVYATAVGSTQSTTLSATANFGWPLNFKAFAFEPYLRGEYSRIKINGFSESSTNNVGSRAGQPAGFDFHFDDQSISSFDANLGLRLQYTLTPKFAVITPYATAEFHHNLNDTTHNVTASFNGIGGSGGEFNLSGDPNDTSYYTFMIGMSVVIRGGWQGFVQYRTIEQLESVSNHSVALGLRAEF